MDKLSQFYLDLSTDASKLELFNSGKTVEEVAENRKKILSKAGIKESDEIISLTQSQLKDLMAKKLSSVSSDWSNLEKSATNGQNTNTTNTDNNVSLIGLRRSH
ncbi:hypothetical protein [Aliikangiella coralliicola]|uniref:Uncharacterized protein n=1 Tax=Aliikangiella coralliicola TaxID=2592383 RepID=A0A545U8K7_9GAMM|nr:hypothetical protein [Aliikangiella coralliicola]TQV85801.1 hypothetical protein FLL46_17910 [Aliikangiella coralliicola]